LTFWQSLTFCGFNGFWVQRTTNMSLPRSLVCFGLLVGMAAPVQAATTERNRWPVRVSQLNAAGEVESWQGLGPLLFKKPAPEGGTSVGFRPFYLQTKNAAGDRTQALFLYPLFEYTADNETFRWSVFELIKRSGPRTGTPNPNGTSSDPHRFEVWPFWFSRQDPNDPASSYRALFPLRGEMTNRFGYQRLSWTLWPFYVQSEKRGATTTSTPWPFVRVTQGTSNGFALWPLFGWKNGSDETRQRFYLWPFAYDNSSPPPSDAPEGSPPSRQFGVLPLYTREQSAGFINENYLWPFFGRTDRTSPYRYHEARYFWPFFVQARGDDRYRNRWGPFYTHSVVKGYDKTWIGWPIYRHARWTDDNLTQNKRQVLFFLYYSVHQQSASNPALAPANKTHVWPFYSNWDNGAGRRQVQVFSPLEVFFPNNDKMRQVWTPLFAIYRFDQPGPGYVRHSFLWNAVSFRRDAERSEFHFGPLFSIERNSGEKRMALAKGLVTLHRGAKGNGWHVSWLKFSSKRANLSASALSR
jgi:hypothetical protein